MHGISPGRDVDVQMIAENWPIDEVRLHPDLLTGAATKATITVWATI
jgi:hypothetical protein